MSPGKHNPIKKKLTKEKVLGMMSEGVDQSIHSADKVIETNNLKSKAGLGGSKVGSFFVKQAIKQGLKNYVGPMVSKAFGVASMFLTPTAGYAQTKKLEGDFKSDEEVDAEFERRRRADRAKKKGIKTIMDPDY